MNEDSKHLDSRVNQGLCYVPCSRSSGEEMGGAGGSGGEEMGGAGDLVVSGNGVLARQGVLNDKGGTQRS